MADLSMGRPRSGFFDRWSASYDRPGLQYATYRPVHDAAIARLAAAQPSVDVVVCTESFHWYRDQVQVMSGLAALMRPEWQLLVASIASVTNVGDSAVRQLSSVAGQSIRALTPRRLKGLLTTAGFDVVYQQRVPRLGFVPWPALTEARLRPTF